MGKLSYIALALIGFFAGMVTTKVAVDYFYPTTGIISTLELSVKWFNGTDVTTIDWLITENNTEYVMDPMNITNIGTTPVYLTISYTNPINILKLQLSWNYTGNLLEPNDWEIVELYQNCTAGTVYSYSTVITATEE